MGNTNDRDRGKPAAAWSMPWSRIGLIVAGFVLLTGAASAAAPTADFTCTQISVEPPMISCTDQSSGNPTGWAWFFGDETYSGKWVLMNNSTPWTQRVAQATMALPNGTVVTIGGTTFVALNKPRSWAGDTWISTDKGKTWINVTRVALEHRPGFSATLVNNRDILVTGGYAEYDAQRSSDGGATWVQVAKDLTWLDARHDFGLLTLQNNNVVLFGGQEYYGDTLNDTYISVDYGDSWTPISTSQLWSSRAMFSSVALSNNEIVMTGGMNSGGTRYNETWSSRDNGITWTLINSSSGWEPRRYHTSVAMPDESIVLMGGSNIQKNPPFNDIWRSTDYGATWTQVNTTPEWSPRFHHSSTVLPDASIVLVGGTNNDTGDLRDVWRLDPAASPDQNPLPHKYAGPGTYQVTLRVYNADGYTTIRKFITVGESQYYINVKPVPEIHVGDKFTINATTNLPAGQEVLVEAYAPYFDRNHKPQSGEFSGVSNMVKVQAGAPDPACSCCEQVNFFIFDIDSSAFKPDVYLINDTAMGIPQLGRSYFYVRGGGTPVTPLALDPLVIVCGIAGAYGLAGLIRRRKP